MVRVLLFGRLRDAAGWREREIDPAPSTVLALKALLASTDPVLGQALDGPGVKAAINKNLVVGDALLPPGCEVAFLPPMSGG